MALYLTHPSSMVGRIVHKGDVFVDGRFQVENKDLRLQWCGSTNQRVIDMQKTLEQGKVILYKSDYTK